MIKINKTSIPSILTKKGDKWTRDLMNHYHITGKLHKGFTKRYRHKDIKKAIRLETNGKCAYCESKIDHIYYGDIEHIIPKTHFPRLTFTWKNLTLGCYICNNKKHDFIDRSCMLLSPVLDDIENHIFPIGDMIYYSTERGELTVKQIELNRLELKDKRAEKIEVLVDMIFKFKRTTSNHLKLIIKDEINEFIEREYSFVLRPIYIDQIVSKGL